MLSLHGLQKEPTQLRNHPSVSRSVHACMLTGSSVLLHFQGHLEEVSLLRLSKNRFPWATRTAYERVYWWTRMLFWGQQVGEFLTTLAVSISTWHNMAHAYVEQLLPNSQLSLWCSKDLHHSVKCWARCGWKLFPHAQVQHSFKKKKVLFEKKIGSEVVKLWTAGRTRKSLFFTPSVIRFLLTIVLACTTHTHRLTIHLCSLLKRVRIVLVFDSVTFSDANMTENKI